MLRRILVFIVISCFILVNITVAKVIEEFPTSFEPSSSPFYDEEQQLVDVLGISSEVKEHFDPKIDEEAFLNQDSSSEDSANQDQKTLADSLVSAPAEDEAIIHDENLGNLPNLELYSNKTIERFIDLYTKRKRKGFLIGLKRYSTYMPLLLEIFSQYNLPPQLVNLAIVESNLNPRAVSRANAVGLWQFIASTGRNYNLNSDFYYDERLNVEKATHAAAQLLRDLYATFDNWDLALAAYNSGPGNVRRAIRINRKAKKPINFWNLRLPRETRGYVPAFYAVNIILSDPQKYGIPLDLLDLDNRPSFVTTKEIAVPPSVKFQQISQRLGLPMKTLVELNLEYKMQLIPPINRQYTLNVPSDLPIAPDYYASFTADTIPNLIRHKVRSGDTFSSIAKKYRTSVRALQSMNSKVHPRRLQIGQSLIVAVAAKDKNFVRNFDGVNYKVVRGDTLGEISSYFGISLSKLLALNKTRVSVNRPLQIGTVLRVR